MKRDDDPGDRTFLGMAVLFAVVLTLMFVMRLYELGTSVP